MNSIESTIEEKLSGLTTPLQFAQAIGSLGLELMESGQLDSDELLWEVGRKMWKDFAPGFESQVSDEFHKILEQS